MAHKIETMMYVGTPPWHGLGTPVETEVTSGEALKLAGLDWSVATMPVSAEVGSGHSRVPGAKAVVRCSDLRPLGIVGDRFVPVQNDSAFRFFDEVVGSGDARYHTAGSLDGGRKVWMLAKLPGHVRVGEDVAEKFVLLANAHDGSSALRMFLTPVRVVCANTLNLALSQAGADGISIRHTVSATQRIEEARRALGIASSYFDRFSAEANALLEARYTDNQMRELAEHVLPSSSPIGSVRITRLRDRVVELFTEGAGHDRIRGTGWGALNAVAEFADHHRAYRGADPSERAQNRLKAAWFGSGMFMKRRAHQFIAKQLAVA